MTAMNAPDWTLDLPTEWKTADWDENHIQVVVEHTEARAIVVSAMLTDGSNILGLLWEGGQRLARCNAEGVIDERYSGRFPRAYRDELSETWKLTVSCLVKAKHATERELGPAVVRTHRDRARWLLSNAPGAAEGLRFAYEKLERPDIPFATFRELIEHEAGWHDEADESQEEGPHGR